MNDKANAPKLSRRSLVRSGLIGFGLVVLAGTGIAIRGTKLRPLPRGGLKVLSPEEYAILAAFAARVCPPKSPGIPDANDLDVAALVDAMVANAEPDVKEGLKVGLRILENGLSGALFGERITPFTQLSPEDQDRTLLAFRHSRVEIRRALFRGFMGVTTAVYYGQDAAWAGLGYGGPPNPAALRTAYAGQLVDLDALVAPSNGGPR